MVPGEITAGVQTECSVNATAIQEHLLTPHGQSTRRDIRGVLIAQPRPHRHHACCNCTSTTAAAVCNTARSIYMADHSESIVKSPLRDSIANPISGMNTTGLSACLSPLPSA